MGSSRIYNAVLVFVALFFLNASVSAEIYRYVDEQGVWHFSNTFTDTRYEVWKPVKFFIRYENIGNYKEIIAQASEKFGVPISLIKAVIRAESGFNENAVSSKGAKGLMQLMPDTAGDLNVGDPLDPEENILGGVEYLSKLLKRFGNDKTLALAAYNAGPAKVDVYKGIPPYKETRGFVKKVLDFHEKYSDEP